MKINFTKNNEILKVELDGRLDTTTAPEFESFLGALPEGEIKAEYALPTMVDKMIHTEVLSVDALATDAVWFGVTYKEDKPYVAEELGKMHESGLYPEKL